MLNFTPPKVLDKVKKVFKLLRSGERDKVVMWFKSEKMENSFISPMQPFVMKTVTFKVF